MVDWVGVQKKLWEDRGLLFKLLLPCSLVYERMVRYRLLKSYRSKKLRKKVPARVISVGNIVAGGTGKTPMVKWLCERLVNNGRSVCVVSRGYGRKSAKDDVIVLSKDNSSVSWTDVGDEPYMLSSQLKDVPILVGRNRFYCAREAVKRFNPDVIIMDDGFQHLALERDVDLVLLDCKTPFDNGYLIPLGRMREPVSHLVRADAFILTRVPDKSTGKRTEILLKSIFSDIPVFQTYHRATCVRNLKTGDQYEIDFLKGKRIMAFSGIGNPDAFTGILKECGALLAECVSFPDHYCYSKKDLDRLLETAEKNGVEAVITTEKDVVRLPCNLSNVENLFSLLIEVEFSGEALFCEWLEKRVGL